MATPHSPMSDPTSQDAIDQVIVQTQRKLIDALPSPRPADDTSFQANLAIARSINNRQLERQRIRVAELTRENPQFPISALLLSTPEEVKYEYYAELRIGRCFRSVDSCQADTPNSYRFMKRPITRSCMVVFLEKQIVRRTNRLIRVRKLMCLLSIFWVFAFPTVCCSASTCRS